MFQCVLCVSMEWLVSNFSVDLVSLDSLVQLYGLGCVRRIESLGCSN